MPLRRFMSTLLWIVVVVAVIFLVIGGTVKTVSFLLRGAPILLVVAVVMFLVNRSRGGRGVCDAFFGPTEDVPAADAVGRVANHDPACGAAGRRRARIACRADGLQLCR
jgi:hypothetical protein